MEKLLGHLILRMLLMNTVNGISDNSDVGNDFNILTFAGIEDTKLNELGTGEYLRHLYTEDNYLLLGGRSFLYNVSTATMQLNVAYRWVNDFGVGTICNDSHHLAYDGDCFNYVMSASKENDTRFVVCTAAGVESVCKLLRYESNVWMLIPSTEADVQSIYPEYITPWLYAPPWQWTRRLIHNTAEGVEYALSMRLDRGFINGFFHFIRSTTGDKKGMLTPSTNEYIARDINNFMFTPNFGGIFDTAEHVYVLYSEPAVESFESIETERSQYSRIARVCKNDDGESARAFYFSSFFKARILCGPKSKTLGQTSNRVKPSEGYYQTYLDVIQDISEVRNSSVATRRTFFALFTTQRGGLDGSAICEYGIEDIEKYFAANRLVNGSGFVDQENPTECVPDTLSMTQSEKEIRKFHWLANTVRSIDNDVVFFMKDIRMTRMVTDWQVTAADGNKYDVIFTSTEDGRLFKLVKYQTNSKEKRSYHIVEEMQVFDNLRVQQLTLITDDLGGRYLIMNSFADVKRVPVERCHQYVTCSRCLASRDPYCAWSEQLAKCVPTTHKIGDKKANIVNGTDNICDPPPSTTITYVMSTTPSMTSIQTTTTGTSITTPSETSSQTTSTSSTTTTPSVTSTQTTNTSSTITTPSVTSTQTTTTSSTTTTPSVTSTLTTTTSSPTTTQSVTSTQTTMASTSTTTTPYMTSTQTTKTGTSMKTPSVTSTQTTTSNPSDDAAKSCVYDQLLYPLIVIAACAFCACVVAFGYQFSKRKSERNLVEPHHENLTSNKHSNMRRRQVLSATGSSYGNPHP